MPEPFKNRINSVFVNNFASLVFEYDITFNKQGFINAVLSVLETLELKQRINLISTCLKEHWNKSYTFQIAVLVKIKQDTSLKLDGLCSLVFSHFVQQYGLDSFDVSIKALEVFTIESTSEFAIRPFIIKYETKTMQQMQLWAKHENEHIRRLSSEGCRPRLPWAMSLPLFKQNPQKIMEIIELLKNDKSTYVQKSVANNLNDISKDNPDIVIAFIKNNIGVHKHLDWILKHGARTLLKASNKEVLTIFGYVNNNITLQNLQHETRVKLNENMPFSFHIVSEQKLGKIRLEYALEMVRKNGKKNKKVFHISTGDYNQKSKHICTKHSFKKVTTRNYYVGLHKIHILVNGVELSQFEFDLIEE